MVHFVKLQMAKPEVKIRLTLFYLCIKTKLLPFSIPCSLGFGNDF